MSEQTTQTKPQINELNKFAMFTPCPTAAGFRSKLGWSIRDGNPRVSVFTNDPNDKISYGIIPAPMNPETFMIFLTMFEGIIKGANGQEAKIDCFTAYKDNDTGKQLEKTLLSVLKFGKNDNGICWISVQADNRPKVIFEFQISDFHKIYKPGNIQFTQSEGSMQQAMAVIRTIREMYTINMNGYRVTVPRNENSNSRPQPQNNNQTNQFDDVGF